MLMFLLKCWPGYKILHTLQIEQILQLRLQDWQELFKIVLTRSASRDIFKVLLTKLQAAMLAKVPTHTTTTTENQAQTSLGEGHTTV